MDTLYDILGGSSGEPCYGLAATAVKAQDELAALGLDCRLANQKKQLSGQKKTLDMNLPNQKIP
jgi:hypothetical protein